MAASETSPLLARKRARSWPQITVGSGSQNMNNGQDIQGNGEQNPHFLKPEDLRSRQKFLFILGVWKFSDTPHNVEGKCKWILRLLKELSPLLVPGFLLMFSIVTLFVYLFCYYGKANHQLIFLSFVSYWVLLISPEIICTMAFIKNFRVAVPSNDTFLEEAHRGHIFNMGTMSNKFEGKGKKLFMFSVIAVIPFFLRFALFLILKLEGCDSSYDLPWTLNDMLNIIFYTLFCYFLYLQRVALEEEGNECFEHFKQNTRTLEQCKKEVVFFFQNYKRLRDLLLPWIWIILFCSSCGMTAVFTWNYNIVHQSTVSTPEPSPFKTQICSITCDKISFLIAREGNRIILNTTILLRNIITAGFALSVLNGIDLKHVWDSFRQRLFTCYSAANKAKLGELIQFMDSMHTESAVDSFGIMFSIAGLLIGILGSDNLR